MLDVATRAGKLIPMDETQRAEVVAWVVAALKSIEPFLMNVAEVEYFLEDKQQKAARRPLVVKAAAQRLSQLQTVLAQRDWLVGSQFSVADLMMASVLKIAHGLHLLEPFPRLIAYQDRCLDRPAYRKAIGDKCATIAAHEMSDIKFPRKENADA